MEDKDLFELCKQVYEKTGWSEPGQRGFMNNHGLIGRPWQIPLYTSDYILEKLPRSIGRYELEMSTGESYYSFGYRGWVMNGVTYSDIDDGESDTALKALLKLTLALHDAGELK